MGAAALLLFPRWSRRPVQGAGTSGVPIQARRGAYQVRHLCSRSRGHSTARLAVILPAEMTTPFDVPLGIEKTSDRSWPRCVDHHVTHHQWIRGDIMMWFMLVATILLATPAPIMAAQNDTLSIRSANVGRDGNVVAVVGLPPGVSPK